MTGKCIIVYGLRNLILDAAKCALRLEICQRKVIMVKCQLYLMKEAVKWLVLSKKLLMKYSNTLLHIGY